MSPSAELQIFIIWDFVKKKNTFYVSNYVLKRSLHQLRASGHVKRRNGQYVSTGKRIQRSIKKRKLLTRKARRRVLKQARQARKAVKKQVSSVLKARNAVLEKLILKSIRRLKREHKGQSGFMFNQIKSSVKGLARHKAKKLRNVVIVKALESLRASGKIVLKKGKNLLVPSSTPSKKNKVVKKTKKNSKKRHRKSTRKIKRISRPTSHGDMTLSFIKELLPEQKESRLSRESIISKHSSKFTEDLIKTSLTEAKNEYKMSSSSS